jgi:hypothetical protein
MVYLKSLSGGVYYNKYGLQSFCFSVNDINKWQGIHKDVNAINCLLLNTRIKCMRIIHFNTKHRIFLDMEGNKLYLLQSISSSERFGVEEVDLNVTILTLLQFLFYIGC